MAPRGGRVDPLHREIVIHRTCARARNEYEWGVHATAYGKPPGLTDEQLTATVHGTPDDPAWSEQDALLIRLADELDDTCAISDPTWTALTAQFRDDQLLSWSSPPAGTACCPTSPTSPPSNPNHGPHASPNQ
jgi:4-carboxymuconolactone decarboxylase